jgi:subtilisin family serine protease
MPHPDLPTYRDGFFTKFLKDLPGSPTVASLESSQPSGQPLSLLGEYVEYSGPPLTPLPNASIKPQFAIRAGEGTPQTYVMLWIVERFDVASDSPETIGRILADFRSPTAQGTSDTDSLGSALARTWAQALTKETVRAALAKNLDTITAVPAGLPTTDLDELKTFLLHFGTYKANGTYYAKGAVPEGQFPNGVKPEYLAADTGNVAEVKLQRDSFYCYALVPETLWSARADPQKYRQLVYRIEDRGADAPDRFRLALLHTVSAREATAAKARFIFFFAAVGLGLAVPDAARSSLSASAAALAAELPDRVATLSQALQDPLVPIVGTQDAPYALFIAAVKPDFPSTPLPDGVIAGGEGAVRTLRVPPPHVMTLAARPDIENLVASTPVWLTMVDARREMNLAGRTFPAGITAANTGKGVLIGFVDSGIDGGHPAFLGRADDPTKTRIHSIWAMGESGGDDPYRRSERHANYIGMNFGKEYIGHDEVSTATDYYPDGLGGWTPGHGTHVAGIAAGRALAGPGWPGGVAPGATIVVASTGRAGYVNDVIAGVKYCFNKAIQLNMPCVVNISLCTERHSHDGTDPLSIALTQLVSENVIPAAGLGVLPSAMPRYKPGRIICAAAGNFRNFNLHWQAAIPAGGEVTVMYQPFSTQVSSANAEDGVTFWAYNEDATTVRLRVSTRHSSNAVLATPEIALRGTNAPVSTDFAGGLRVNIHNGQEAPNNRHFNPEIYWIRPAPAAPVANSPWLIRLRNDANSPCVVHGFGAFREHRGGFIFNPAATQPRIGVTYTAAELRQFESTKIGTPGTAPGVITVAAFCSRPGLASVAGMSQAVGEIAWFSSPGPLRAVGAGQRAIDVALPGHAISSAKSWMPNDTSRTVTDMSGTSMATPMMTGLVAALLQQNPTLNTAQVVTRLELAARRRATDSVEDWGLGRVDASLLQP